MSAAEQVILAVEDDDVMRQLYEGVLNRPGWRAVLAPTLAAADRALDEQHISLVVLDLFLPDGDGRTWLARLRARPANRYTPVIVVAGTALVDAQVDVYELGADTMITKPVAPQVLVAAVTGALQRASRHAPEPPAVSAPAVSAPAVSAPAVVGPPSPGVVLLAEDDDVVAALVEHRLGREGFTVVRASDGPAALERATETPIVLAILDVMLPGLDGFEVLAGLRKLPALAKVPIVMLTGRGSEKDVERALRLGANDYVLKPFSPVELTARVRRLVRGS